MQKQQQEPAQQPGNMKLTQQQQLEQMRQQQEMEKRRAQGGEQDQEQVKEQDQEEEERVSDFDIVLRKLGKLEAEVSEDTTRKTPGRVTRFVADLMIFVEVSEGGSPLGLVFKPDKIVDYHGEHLQDLGIRVGTIVSEISWDIATLKVSSVDLGHRTESRTISASA
jgi:hypothetical protein